ncbi:MAG: alpha-L-rhamnosidase N-terminal domain-containing protein [Candidatus Latescibacterota bacterium]
MGKPYAVPAVLMPVDLRCEYLVNPVGIDRREPRLSWTVVSEQPGQQQSAYRVTVASSTEALQDGATDLWDSGKVSSAETLHLPCPGLLLRGRQRCYWQVQVWDQDGEPAGRSEPAWFEMGLLEPGDWGQAQWIAAGQFAAAPRLRRAFVLRGPVASARLYLCGQGVCEASLNGRPVSDQVLGPTLSYFARRMFYDTFEVTPLLREGENALGVWLAPGWFGDPATWAEMHLPASLHAFPYPPHALRALLAVRYADGSEEEIGTDGQWKAMDGPLTPVRSHWKYCFGFSGEIYDGTRETPGWDSPGFDDREWTSVNSVSTPTAELNARPIEPNRVRQMTTPVTRERLDPGMSQTELLELLNRCAQYNGGSTFAPEVWFFAEWQRQYRASLERCGGRFLGGWVYDLGRHVSGWVELRVTGRPGDWVCLFGLDCHRLQGGPQEVVRLRFAHRVVRYVPVLFFGGGVRPEVNDVRGLDLSSDVESVGRFACSDAALSEVAAVTQRTVEAHLLSGMFMDSWQERFGTFVPGEAAVWGWGLGALCGKLATDFRDQQRPDGWAGMYGAPISLDYPMLKESLAHLPWLAYLFYGDQEILRENYPSIRRYTELVLPRHDLTGRTWQPPEPGRAEPGYGDHGRPTARWYDPHTGDLFETMAMIGYLRTVERIARVLGENADVERYRLVQRGLIEKCNRVDFLDREAGLYGGGDQGCHALALILDLAPPGVRDQVAGELLRDLVETRQGHLNTGFNGTVALLQALIQLDRPDVAHRLIAHETPPSLWSMLRHPQTPERLTIMPEFWTGGMIPHPGLSTIGFWFYRGLGGLSPEPEHPGFRRFTVRPQIPPGLTWAEVEYQSLRGRIAVRWERDDDRLILKVTVPANTQARIHLPGGEARLLEPASSMPSTRITAGETVFTVPGGCYAFSARAPRAMP